jgi:hypothetical protein
MRISRKAQLNINPATVVTPFALTLNPSPILGYLAHKSLTLGRTVGAQALGLGGSPPNPPFQGTAFQSSVSWQCVNPHCFAPEPPPEGVNSQIEDALRIAKAQWMKCFCSQRKTQSQSVNLRIRGVWGS